MRVLRRCKSYNIGLDDKMLIKILNIHDPYLNIYKYFLNVNIVDNIACALLANPIKPYRFSLVASCYYIDNRYIQKTLYFVQVHCQQDFGQYLVCTLSLSFMKLLIGQSWATTDLPLPTVDWH